MLDFSKLKNNATKRPTTQGNGAANSFIPTDNKNAVAGEYGSDKSIDQKQTEKQPKNEPEPTQKDYLLQVGKQLQENIRKGGRSTWDIFKSMKADRPPEEIALIAVKGLSLVLDDQLLYKTVSERYRQQYGISLTDEPPFTIIRDEPQKPLD